MTTNIEGAHTMNDVADVTPTERFEEALAIGIYDAVKAELGGLADDEVLGAAFRIYCGRAAYRKALAVHGAVRIALDGTAAPVSAGHVKHAKGHIGYRRHR
jgi:sRNA-binding protein